MNDPVVYEYLESGGNYDIEQLYSYVNEQLSKDVLFWAIHEKTSNKHIGNIKIDPINISENSGEYGIMIGDRESWGKGYAKESTALVINHCFEVLKISTITLGVVCENQKAIKLYKDLGFEVYETKSNIGTYNGKLCDSYRMKLNDDGR
jgi:RimJ/RimL family protein N-acetyltransferase